MKLGLGLYRDSLTEDNFRFTVQCGATHIIPHLTNYFGGKNPNLSSGDEDGWGSCIGDPLWGYEELKALVDAAGKHGLTVAGLENFSPNFWSDVLLDGPERKAQMDGLKQLIRDIGRAGIPVMGYCFTLVGVWGWFKGPSGRGGAVSVGFDATQIDPDKPIPDGVVWNMRVRDGRRDATPIRVSESELWQRLEWFLKELVPVAEEAGVRLAAHPDDPPVPELRGCARLLIHPDRYQRLLNIVPSKSNAVELCLGTFQEMAGSDVYGAVRDFARKGQIGYIHMRNVRGKVPNYQEMFIDEGDLDMTEIVRILRDEAFDGVLVPDHTPEMACSAPWHAGKAFALGYMKALIQNAASLGASRTAERKLAAE